MPIYEWKNVETGEVISIEATIDLCHIPPQEEGEWVRDYRSVAIGQVEGAGGSPSRGPSRYKKTNSEQ